MNISLNLPAMSSNIDTQYQNVALNMPLPSRNNWQIICAYTNIVFLQNKAQFYGENSMIEHFTITLTVI